MEKAELYRTAKFHGEYVGLIDTFKMNDEDHPFYMVRMYTIRTLSGEVFDVEESELTNFVL